MWNSLRSSPTITCASTSARRRERGANYVQSGLFKAFAVRDGRLITGQQQYSGRKVAQMVIEALGV
jgi:putative intracellular protease/amidase